MVRTRQLSLLFLTLLMALSGLVGLAVVLGATAADGALKAGEIPPVVINEVAWGGTAADGADEWIELFNRSGQAVDLTGWSLAASDGTPTIVLQGIIATGDFLLLERTDDSTVSDIPADRIYGGNLLNSGERLYLRDAADNLIDSANLDGGAWPAGTGWPEYASMERVDPSQPDLDVNWLGNDGTLCNGLDAAGFPLRGTPASWNSVAVVADVAITQEGPSVVSPGATFSLALSLQNDGQLDAIGLVVTDSMPAGVVFLDSTASFSLTRPTSRTLVWRAGDLAAGATLDFSFRCQLLDGIDGWITNTVVVAQDAPERIWQNNRSEWPILVSDPSAYADLRVGKGGPWQVAAGELVTYQLEIANQGGRTAYQVLLTDVMPTGVLFVAQDSPVTFTHPSGSNLRWQVGALEPAATPLTWTVVGMVPAGASGWMTNMLTATSATPEVNFTNNSARVSTHVQYTPTIRLTAVHYYALQGGDEAVQLANLGAGGTDLAGWCLTDNVSSACFPAGAILPAGGTIWVANEALAFADQFGFAPDWELGNTDPAVPRLDGVWPGFANQGDQVILRDDTGQAQDVLVYGDAGEAQPGWEGTPLQPYHPGPFAIQGQILYRKLDQALGGPVPDTDTAADWAQDPADLVNGRKVRYPGWDLETFFQPARITETATVALVVGPDALFAAVKDEIAKARRSIQIHSYTFEHTDLALAVAARAAAGVAVTVLLDGNPTGGISDQQRWVCAVIEQAGGRCLFMVNDPDHAIYDRYAQQHAKYVLIDGRRVMIGSENLSLESMPPDEKSDGTAGRRGLMLITDAAGVVAHVGELYALDADPVDHRDIMTSQVIGPPPSGYRPVSSSNWVTYSAAFSRPLVMVGEFAFEVIQSPENSLRDRDALLGLLARAGAGDTILVEQMYEHTYWGAADSDPDRDPNLRLAAYLAAARRGARVCILLDEYLDLDPADPRGNRATCWLVNEIAAAERLALSCRLGNPTGMGIHNKMVLVQLGEQGFVHLGSINGSEISSKGNRELAIQLASNSAYAYLAAVFERDWPHQVHLPLAFKDRRGPADHLLISEVLYDAAGSDAEREWIELYNPTPAAVDIGGWYLGDATVPVDYEGMYRFPAGTVIGGGQTMVVAVSGPAFLAEYYFDADLELLSLSPQVPDMIRVSEWGSGDFELGNTGDELLLLDGTAAPVDVLVWGDGSFAATIPHTGVLLAGHSLERYPPRQDTADCSHDYRDWPFPNPGTVPAVY